MICRSSHHASDPTTVSLVRMVLGFVLVTALPVPAVGQQEPADIAGSRDHPALDRRFPGSTIVEYSHRDFDEFILPVGPIQREGAYSDTTRLEGAVTRIVYRIDKQRSQLEVARTYENALRDLGYEPVWSCTDRDCGGRGFNLTAAHYQFFGNNWGKQRYLAARKGSTWINFYVVRRYTAGGPDKDYIYAQLNVIETGEMGTELITVDAAAMEKALADRGRVALYDIRFDFDTADLLPESQPQLEEIAKFLQSNDGLELLIVGHTDNVGTLDYNIELSRRRADAVRSDLAERYGIDAARLEAHGVGYLAPVATNETEEGQAANRRVELVRG